MASRFLLRYRCLAGHEFTAPFVMDSCPAYHRGSPCKAEIKQYAGPKQKVA